MHGDSDGVAVIAIFPDGQATYHPGFIDDAEAMEFIAEDREDRVFQATYKVVKIIRSVFPATTLDEDRRRQ